MGQLGPRRQRMHEVIFEAETSSGKAFDVVLLVCIVLSVIAVVLESVEDRLFPVFGRGLEEEQWKFNVLKDRVNRQEVVCLEDEPDIMVTQVRGFTV